MAQKSKGSRKILKQKIAVIGIGRVGLPLAIFLADHGQIVHGIDVDQQKINIVSRGKMPFLEEGAQSLLKKYVNKTLSFSSDFSKIKDCQVLILTLGTPVDENMNPSLTQIDNALEASKPYLKKDQLLILRSTVSPRTTAYVKSYINDLKGLEVSKNFFLAFCPERIAEGNPLPNFRRFHKLLEEWIKKASKKLPLFSKILE